jgi:hypothetical protein
MIMRFLFSIAIAACAVATKAAIISGSVLGSTGTNRVTKVICVPLNGPRVVGTNYIYPVTQTVLSDTNGVFTLQCLQGDYGLAFGGGAQAISISVPDTTNSLDFLDLIETNGLTCIYRAPGALIRISALDSAWGFLSDKLTNGVSILLTTITNGFGQALAISLDPSIASSIAAKFDASGGTVNGDVLATGRLQGTTLTLLNGTNQIIFGAAGSGPADTNNIALWIQTQITGATNIYWLPVYE